MQKDRRTDTRSSKTTPDMHVRPGDPIWGFFFYQDKGWEEFYINFPESH